MIIKISGFTEWHVKRQGEGCFLSYFFTICATLL
jgi:hypothetical protein